MYNDQNVKKIIITITLFMGSQAASIWAFFLAHLALSRCGQLQTLIACSLKL
jgi:hypothetical protein